MADEKDVGTYTAKMVDGKNIIFSAGPPAHIANRFLMHKKEKEQNFTRSSRFDSANTNTTVTNGYSEDDRDYFRPESAIPTQPTEIIAACMQAYDKFPIVHNIIDMMADFTVKGIDIVNKSQKAQEFARDWAARINIKDRAERIAHMLYLGGTVPIERTTGSLPEGYKKQYEPKLKFKNPLAKGKIPIGYTIYNPANLMVPSEYQTTQTPNVSAYSIINYMKGYDNPRPNSPLTMPRSWLKKTQQVETLQLEEKKHIMLFYKRMDHEVLPKPLTYSLLRNLRNLNQLIACDDSALDGAISRTVLWRLGYINEKDPELSVYPTEEAFSRLSEMLAQSPNGGSREIVWGPELDFKEVQTDVYNFLGVEKYVPTINAIREGYGVPASLTGGSGSAGYTNNVVSLKTLSERLEYGRNVIIAFFEYELAIIQDAMGFRYPFKLIFDQPTISDEAAEKKLIIELYDRGIVSREFVQERYGAIPEIETSRVRRESEQHKSGQLPPKAGPYFSDSLQKNSNEKTFVANGWLTPSQVGLEYSEPKESEMEIFKEVNGNNLEEQALEQSAAEPEANPTIKKKRGVKSIDKFQPKKPKGRPKGSQDKSKRKKKTVTPLGFGAFLIKVSSAKAAIDELLRPAFLATKNKGNSRQLTTDEFNELETLTFATLYSLGDFDDVSPDAISSVLDDLKDVPQELVDEMNVALSDFNSPTTDTIRQVKLMVIASDKFCGVNNIETEEENNED